MHRRRPVRQRVGCCVVLDCGKDSASAFGLKLALAWGHAHIAHLVGKNP